MEEGKLFLSITVLYCHDYLIFFTRRSFLQDSVGSCSISYHLVYNTVRSFLEFNRIL